MSYSLQLLISTMHQVDHDLLREMNVTSDAVVINQCDFSNKEEFDFRGHRILWIDTTERGLSRSRNMAIKNANADICVLADDDEVLCDGYCEKISKAFDRNKSISIIRFKIMGIEKEFKKYPQKKCNISFLSSLKMSSVEIAFKRKDIVDNNIGFDELLGAGTEFKMGEENAFIAQIMRMGLKISYEPIMIAKLHMGDSSWFEGYNEDYFIGRGAAFTAISRRLSKLLIMQFAIRRYALYRTETKFLVACKYMYQGRRRYLKLKV